MTIRNLTYFFHPRNMRGQDACLPTGRQSFFNFFSLRPLHPLRLCEKHLLLEINLS